MNRLFRNVISTIHSTTQPRLLISVLFGYILFSILPGEPTVPVGYYSGYVVAISLSMIILIYSIYRYNSYNLDRRGIELISVVITLYIFSGIYHIYTGKLSQLQILEILVISVVTLINLIIIPKTFSADTIAWLLSSLAAVTILAGIPPVIVGEYTIFGFEFIPYATPALFPIIEDGINSYFKYMNAMNRLAVWGLISSIFLYVKNRSNYQKFFLIVNTAGSVLSSRRQTALLLVLVIPIGVAYYYNKHHTQKWVANYLQITLLGGIIALLSFITTPLTIPVIDASTRMEIWENMWQIIVENPVFGTGPREFSFSPLNGYLLSGVTSGIASLICYTILPITLFGHVTSPVSRKKLYILLIVYSTFIFQFFERFNMIGLNFDSTITAIFIGFLLLRPSN